MNKPKLQMISVEEKINEIFYIESYGMVEDPSSGERYILLKLYNDSHQIINQASISFTELNEKKDPLSTKTYELNDLFAKPKDYCIPLVKMRVSSLTDSLVFNSIDYHFSANTNQQIKDETSISHEDNDVLYPIQKEIPLSLRFKTKFFMVLFALIAIITLSTDMYIYYYNYPGHPIYQNRLIENTSFNFDYELISDGEAIKITGYIGNSKSVNIPADYQGIPITEIAPYAFSSLAIEYINFSSDITIIGHDAFSNMSHLKSVTGYSVSTISDFAFLNCIHLETFSFADIGMIKDYAFSNTPSLMSLEIETIKDTIFTYHSLQNSSLSSLDISHGMVVYDHMLVSIHPDTDVLFLGEEHQISSISKHAFREAIDYLQVIEIDIPFIHLTKDIFYYAQNVDTIYLNPNITANHNLFYYISGTINHLTIPVIGDHFTDLFSDKDVVIYNLNIHGDRPLGEDYFIPDDINILYLYVDPSVPIE